VRQADTVARPGGDEFIIVLVDLSPDETNAALQADSVGTKVLAAINQPCMLANQLHHSSASIGLCLFFGQNATINDILKRADAAMYQAKSSGRNTLCLTTANTGVTGNTLPWVELRNALPNNQFQLYYQIQMDNLDRTGAEVLLRWTPQQGLVLPTGLFQSPKKPDSSCRLANGYCAQRVSSSSFGRLTR
jgi:predicted signal transduction protein with EAL and GGDEF domain